jgi:hypothetical protein
MREDMAKVIVERPRGGRGFAGKGSVRHYQRMDLEELPSHESMLPRFGQRKWLNENLAPFRRFLRSRVGRPWNDVYSEIRARINVNSAVQLHIWQHLQDYVCTNVYGSRGELCNQHRGYLPFFFVDAESGLLCAHLRKWKQRRKRLDTPRDIIRIDAWNEYRRINGIWYLIGLKPLPIDLHSKRDVLLNCTCAEAGNDLFYKTYGRRVYAYCKRQLGSKEIRALMKAEQQRIQRRRDGR